ncbi:hypothetical protein PMZ80_002849 [Knufia obscura]|uniref:Sodium/calcium exchanger membrane region domain-containing protein n=2 Tax=Knufia TaxID=430999 RepID=A0AAN8ESE2_9EURO|nr:hypothetical protein PMZ80_002849 [Knufia obscura]KAK5952561.1 hypothetical protein OHC33_006607 [Knufia fluminis]
MVESVDEPPLRGLHSWAKKLLSRRNPSEKDTRSSSRSQNILPQHAGDTDQVRGRTTTSDSRTSNHTDTQQEGTHAVDKEGNGAETTTINGEQEKPPKAPIHQRFVRDAKRIITASWINWLLVTVPVGIILGAVNDWGGLNVVSPSVVFAINAVAIVPLASLLAYATESVASRMGDSWGALLNVTFGNAVEIIVFVLALVAGEVRIVQAAAVGSILSNLLLILGMSFVLGGLRFREQLFNRSVSQLSACLVSLSVISLLLPTAFHAAFADDELANVLVLKVSRGTSVVLLLVYVLYLLFQLKSHAFMYESTPQHVIDEESHPGVLAQMLDSSSSSSSDSSSTDSDSTAGSHKTANRIKRALRRKRRKSSSSTKEGAPGSFSRSDTHTDTLVNATRGIDDAVLSGDEADAEGLRGRGHNPTVHTRDFENRDDKEKRKKRSKKCKKIKPSEKKPDNLELKEPFAEKPTVPSIQVGFAENIQEIPDGPTGRPVHYTRNLSSAIRPVLNSTNFPHHEATARSLAPPGMRTLDRATSNGNRPRASSMPDIHRQQSSVRAASPRPASIPANTTVEQEIVETVDPEIHLSTTSAIVMLLISTGLVALCAEFLVGSIDHLVTTSGVGQAFIGLIILPIVGNAAEHVTAVTVAYKNKMDLAINIALGSSIQIALFVTPLMVLLGWAIGAEMSLYFSLFETMSLFGAAFVVNYLMIDGRSNYLEGEFFQKPVPD